MSDDQGLLWSVQHVVDGGEQLVMFTCTSDSRRSGRIKSITAEGDVVLPDLPDEVLRDWLRHAPPIGRLS